MILPGAKYRLIRLTHQIPQFSIFDKYREFIRKRDESTIFFRILLDFKGRVPIRQDRKSQKFQKNITL